MPLSEEELRLLEQMERALVAEDPKFVSALRGTARRRDARRRAIAAAAVFVIGVAVLMTGAVTQQTIVGIVGFVVMLASAVLALKYWRGQGAPGAPEPMPESAQSPAGYGLSVVEGGKKSKRRPRSSHQSSSQQSMMQRFEERWRRRRGESGF
ncbi:MAG: DUF3040 domain-containing protein [Brachybacterium paraconglomeratum]|nr:DUF3040 domain-containing protein [Brachybacterium paraconglomeratum]